MQFGLLKLGFWIVLAFVLSLAQPATADVLSYEVNFTLTERIDVNNVPLATEEARVEIFANNLPIKELATTSSQASTTLPEGTYLVTMRTSTCKTAQIIEIVADSSPQVFKMDCQQQ